jgi:integrase
MLRIKFTEPFMTGLRPPQKGKRLEFQDDLEPRLHLRVTAEDVRTWSILGYLPTGQRVRPSLGVYPAVSIAEARKAAVAAAGELARGINPSAVKREARDAWEARKGLATVAARLTQWREAKASDWSEGYKAEVERLCVKLVEPTLGTRKLEETTRGDWTGLLASVRRRTPGTASYLYSTLSSFLNFAEAHAWISVPLLPRKGHGVIAPKPAHRERVLTDAELVRVWNAASELSTKSGAFVKLLILTGARTGEVSDIAVDEIDLAAWTWTIPATRAKNGIAITLPLGPLALAVLETVQPPEGAGPGFRLLGSIRGSGLRAPSKIKVALDRRSGVAGWTLHDLRRTCRTGLSRLGVAPHIAEKCLNHVPANPLVRIYDQHGFTAEIAVAMRQWQDEVARLLRADEAERRGLRLVAG